MTMRELAKLANVSLSTVSKAFLDAKDVSAETKERIFELAKKNGCFGKYYKGKYPNKVIAIICPEVKSDIYANLVEKLTERIRGDGHMPLVSIDGFSEDTQAEIIEYYSSYLKADGILAVSLKQNCAPECRTPIVSIFSNSTQNTDSFATEVQSGILKTVKTLMDYGHEKIAFIGEKLTETRENEYANAMKSLHNPHIMIERSDFRMEKAGEDGIRRLRESGRDFTAVICAYDYMAFGAIRALRCAGLRVPEDVSVIGIDNISASQYSETSLSSIGIDSDAVCDAAWELLMKKMENKYYKNKKKTVVESKLIIRESIAKR